MYTDSKTIIRCQSAISWTC